MVKLPVLKSNGKKYLQLPEELAEQTELELFALKDGFYLLSMSFGSQSQTQTPVASISSNSMVKESTRETANEKKLSEEETSVIKKLLSVRFEGRTPEKIQSILSNTEQSTLKSLEQKGLVWIFKGKKYATGSGVYNISDWAYRAVAGREHTVQAPSQSVSHSSPSSTSAPLVLLGTFRTQWFMILNNAAEAASVSEKVMTDMKKGDVFGVKGFDGKFYLVTRDYLSRARELILKTLVDDAALNIAAIASAAKLDTDGCTAVLHLLAESGDLIEKRKGIYAAV